jgi:hypothetical protein
MLARRSPVKFTAGSSVRDKREAEWLAVMMKQSRGL